MLLLEELARCGVACEFVESPPSETPQERLPVQVQGMIAEYERAQTAERSWRSKRQEARNGSPSVLSGAPYGYRYVKRSEGLEARYEVLAGEADVVRQVLGSYTRDQCSMGAIAAARRSKGFRSAPGGGAGIVR
ncbi:MAG: recombinase family protein [Bryobacterales bacterium]|nr:recombinase family protein [Bryobacterales bacterium]